MLGGFVPIALLANGIAMLGYMGARTIHVISFMQQRYFGSFIPPHIFFFSSCPFCSSHGLIFIIFVIYVRSVSFYSFFRSNEIYCQWILRSRFLFRCISKTMTSERERFSRKIAFVPMHYTSRRFSERSHFCSVSLSRYMNVSGREQISRSRTSFSRFPS